MLLGVDRRLSQQTLLYKCECMQKRINEICHPPTSLPTPKPIHIGAAMDPHLASLFVWERMYDLYCHDSPFDHVIYKVSRPWTEHVALAWCSVTLVNSITWPRAHFVVLKTCLGLTGDHLLRFGWRRPNPQHISRAIEAPCSGSLQYRPWSIQVMHFLAKPIEVKLCLLQVHFRVITSAQLKSSREVGSRVVRARTILNVISGLSVQILSQRVGASAQPEICSM